VQRLLNLQDAIQLLRSEVMTRIFPASSFRYRLHEGAILRRKRGRPIRLVTRLWQQVPELNHLPRRQLVDECVGGQFPRESRLGVAAATPRGQ